MMYLGDYAAGETVYFMWNSADSNGASITRSTNGTISVYKDANVTQTTTGVTDTEDYDSLTGVHHCAIATTDGFYTTATDFMVVLSAATIDTRTVNAVLAHFSIENRPLNAAKITAGAITAAAIATDAIDADAMADGAITAGTFAADAITAAKIADGAIDAATFAAGAITATVIADGAIDAATFAAGAITATVIATGAVDADALAADAVAEIADGVWDEPVAGHDIADTEGQRLLFILTDQDTIQTDLDDIQTRIPAALVGGRMDSSVGAVAANAITAASIATDAIDADALAADAATEIANAVWDTDATAHQTGGTFGQAIGDPVADTNTIFKAVVTDAAGATVGVDIVAVKAETAAILDDTDDIGVAGAGLTAINLPDQTMNITGDITGNLSGSVGSIGAGGIATTSFAAGAIDAAAIAADAIGASELAQAAAQEVADEVLNRNLAGGGSGNSRNVRNALRSLRNAQDITAGTLTVMQEDDATPAWTAAVTTAAGDPLASVDPA